MTISDKNIDKVKNDILQFIFEKSQENLVIVNTEVSKHVITDTGLLLRSGRVEPTRIVYNCPYASDIEFGTDPHYVNPMKLAKWAIRKLNVPRNQAYATGKAISRKIASEGTNPKPFLRNAIQQAQSEYGKEKIRFSKI